MTSCTAAGNAEPVPEHTGTAEENVLVKGVTLAATNILKGAALRPFDNAANRNTKHPEDSALTNIRKLITEGKAFAGLGSGVVISATKSGMRELMGGHGKAQMEDTFGAGPITTLAVSMAIASADTLFSQYEELLCRRKRNNLEPSCIPGLARELASGSLRSVKEAAAGAPQSFLASMAASIVFLQAHRALTSFYKSDKDKLSKSEACAVAAGTSVATVGVTAPLFQMARMLREHPGKTMGQVFQAYRRLPIQIQAGTWPGVVAALMSVAVGANNVTYSAGLSEPFFSGYSEDKNTSPALSPVKHAAAASADETGGARQENSAGTGNILQPFVKSYRESTNREPCLPAFSGSVKRHNGLSFTEIACAAAKDTAARAA